MKRFMFLMALLLVAAPLFAQEEGGGGGGLGGLFGAGDFGNGGGRGSNAPAIDRLVSLRKILADANAPLAKDQEKNLSSMIDSEIKKDIADLEKKFPDEVEQARNAAPRGGGRGAGRGGDRAGGGRAGGGGRGAAANTPMGQEMAKMNEDLQAKVISSLKPEQQAALKKYQTDQIRKAGGLPALKLNMEEAGAPLTPDQETQLQAVYADQDQQRRQLMRETPPDQAKVDALNKDLTAKLLKILNPAQKKALADSMKKAQPR